MCSYLELLICILLVFFFFFNDTATTEIYTLSLHDALPILVTPANGFCNFQCWYDMAIRVSPVNPSLVFVGGAAGRSAVPETVFRSTDGGNSWADVSANGAGSTIHVDTHAFAFSADGKTLYVGNDGGAWSSTDVVNTAASAGRDRKSTRLNSSHLVISYAVFCLEKKKI